MIKIITDSSSELSQEFAIKHDIIIVPIQVAFGDEEFLDGQDLDKPTFYAKLKESENLPKTSLINEARWIEVFEKISNEDQYIVLPITEKLSGTYNSLRQAIKTLNLTNVVAIESNQVTSGLGLLIRKALEKINSGATLEQVVEYIESLKYKIVTYGVLDSLKSLKAGGRISSAKAFFGELLNIKPVLQLKDGVIQQYSKASSMKLGKKVLFSKLKENINGGGYMLSHADCYSNCEEFAEYIVENTGLEKADIDFIGPTVGTHIGPNSLLISIIEE